MTKLVLCISLLVSFGASLIAAQDTRPRRVAEAPTPEATPPGENTAPAQPTPTPDATPQPRPNKKGPPPVLKTRPPREKPLWAEVVIPPIAPPVETAAPPPPLTPLPERLQAAIDTRLGSPYRSGSVGHGGFDCSGFVWSVFNEAGIAFQRNSARSYWAVFTPPQPGEEYKFGTLVFFNRLSHIGIVSADGTGFYHASSSRGVIYSTFDKYWTPRIDGFRRAPQEAAQ